MAVISAVSLGHRTASDRPIAYWLIVIATLVAATLVVGGVTRLTLSGLSITEWRPVTGIVPPLSAGAWADEFAKYKATPQYRILNAGMSLADFKTIFYWEYTHRLLARLVGLAGLLPPIVFLAQGRITPATAPRYFAIPVLVLLQGALGWYMVESGLEARTSVSQYRLTAHLALAIGLYAYAVWSAAGLLRREPLWLEGNCVRTLRRAARAVLALVFVTMMAGALTAGTHAGFTYNTFPLMDGRVVPNGYLDLSPWWLNPFENIAAVQFDHRCLAFLTVCAIVALWAAGHRQKLPRGVRLPLDALLVVALVQVGLGIATLVYVVPIPLAAMHQFWALMLFTSALLTVHGLNDVRQLRTRRVG